LSSPKIWLHVNYIFQGTEPVPMHQEEAVL